MVLATCLACASCQTLSASGAQKGIDPLVQLTADAANKHKVPKDFAIALVEVESGFRPDVISQGNYGLGQIRCGTAKELGYEGKCKGLLKPEVNLHYSMKYLRMALDEANDDKCKAATLYNRGLNARVGKKRSTYCTKVIGKMSD